MTKGFREPRRGQVGLQISLEALDQLVALLGSIRNLADVNRYI